MHRRLFTLCLLIAMARASAQPPVVQSPVVQSKDTFADLPAPRQLEPADGARLSGNPRRIVFKWEPVKYAFGYGIQVDYFSSGKWTSDAGTPIFRQGVKEPTFTFDFVGSQPGAWRVWAMDRDLRPGTASDWMVFSFGPEGEAIPSPPAYHVHPSDRLPPIRGLMPSGPMPTPPVFDPDNHEACGWPAASDPGPGITMPRTIYSPEPSYSDSARKAGVSTMVKLAVDLGADGRPRHICILDAPWKDLGPQAVNTVRNWRFQPATKEGQAIPYNMTVEVSFNLY